jgi:diguanylate cyclase (GGDEF)-like protein/PAS domain S-box-containing protein
MGSRPGVAMSGEHHFDTAPVAVFWYDAERIVTQASGGAVKLLAGTDDPVGSRLLDVLDNEWLRSNLGAESLIPQSEMLEFADHHWLCRLAALDAGGGTCACMEVDSADVAALREAVRYRTILENVTDGIVMQDELERIVYANPRTAEIVGVPLQQLMGRAPADFLRNSNGRREDPARQARRRQGLTDSYEITTESPTGDAMALQITAAPIVNTTGRLAGSVTMIANISERKETERQLRQLALYDHLTGLPNSTLLRDRVDHALARRTDGLVGILFVDLDNLRAVNDSLGHRVGDEVLRVVAHRFSSAIRPQDTLSRLGGDDFVVLCEDLHDSTDCIAVAERLTQSLAKPLQLAEFTIALTASIGIASSQLGTQNDTADADELLRDADAAMNEAKAAGRGQVAVFDAGMADTARQRLRVLSDLRGAADRGELTLHYQPIRRLSDGTVIGAEALARWQHPLSGMLAPDVFIPIAEESRLIIEVGRHLMRFAIEQAYRWNDVRPLVVSVNISVHQLLEPGFVDELATLLSDVGLPPDRLKLEITETVLISELARAANILTRLHALGVKLSLDDFGTGYSSLTYLQALPFDELKLDRGFIVDLTRNGNVDLIRGVIGLAHNIDLDVVAEGVETEAQMSLLQEIGCDFAQGYFIGEPAPAAEIPV